MMSDTIVQMKRKIYNQVKEAWNHDKKDEISDKWLSDTFYINFRHEYTSNACMKGEICDFCPMKHDSTQSLCPIACKGYPDGNIFEQGKAFTLDQVVKQISKPREIKFEISVLDTTKENFKVFGVDIYSEVDEDGTTYITELSTCLNEYSVENEMEIGEVYFCEKCKQDSTVTLQKEIVEAPKILIIHLNRFIDDDSTDSEISDTDRDEFFYVKQDVTFPVENLNIQPYCKEKCLHSNLYDLYALTNYNKSMFVEGGDYWAQCRGQDGEWYKYMNTEVKKTDTFDFENCCTLFYRRKDAFLQEVEQQKENYQEKISEKSDSEKEEKSVEEVFEEAEEIKK